jgi:hypothetical protein
MIGVIIAAAHCSGLTDAVSEWGSHLAGMTGRVATTCWLQAPRTLALCCAVLYACMEQSVGDIVCC